MTERAASAALSTRLNEMTNKPAIAWMNGPTFKPVVDTPWWAEFDLPANTDDPTLSGTGYQDKTGIYQVNVMRPVGEYRYTGIDEAERVKAWFRGFKSSGLVVTSVSIESANRDADWWVTPVSINYRVLF